MPCEEGRKDKKEERRKPQRWIYYSKDCDFVISRYIGVFVWVRCYLWTLKLGITFRVGSHLSGHPILAVIDSFIVEVFSFPPFLSFLPLHRVCMYLNLQRDFWFSYKGVWNVKYFSFVLFLVLFVPSDPCICPFWIMLSGFDVLLNYAIWVLLIVHFVSFIFLCC